MKPACLLTVPMILLASCSVGNDRPYIGNPDLKGGAVLVDALRDEPRPEVPPSADAPSLVSIDRSNWAPQVIMNPMDGVSGTRVYAKNYIWTDSTARQRGQMPTPVSAIEISGDSKETQFWEGLASWPIAVGGAIMIIPRMITHSPFHEVRYFPEQYWRAPVDTQRSVTVVPSAEPVDVSSAPATAPANTAPAAPAPAQK